MIRVTSFIGEHTAEYTLVPKLKKILKKKFEFVTPLFPWLRREFGKLSHYIHGKDEFYVLALYPRRPKISSIDPIEIEIKINFELIEGSRLGNGHGIPVMAGCPLATNFWCLGSEPEFFWVKINEDCNAIYTVRATVSFRQVCVTGLWLRCYNLPSFKEVKNAIVKGAKLTGNGFRYPGFPGLAK